MKMLGLTCVLIKSRQSDFLAIAAHWFYLGKRESEIYLCQISKKMGAGV